jgi:hypothetical protein
MAASMAASHATVSGLPANSSPGLLILAEFKLSMIRSVMLGLLGSNAPLLPMADLIWVGSKATNTS